MTEQLAQEGCHGILFFFFFFTVFLINLILAEQL